MADVKLKIDGKKIAKDIFRTWHLEWSPKEETPKPIVLRSKNIPGGKNVVGIADGRVYVDIYYHADQPAVSRNLYPANSLRQLIPAFQKMLKHLDKQDKKKPSRSGRTR